MALSESLRERLNIEADNCGLSFADYIVLLSIALIGEQKERKLKPPKGLTPEQLGVADLFQDHGTKVLKDLGDCIEQEAIRLGITPEELAHDVVERLRNGSL